MDRALIIAYRLAGNGDNSNNSVKSALKKFCEFIKTYGVKDLRNITRDHVLLYAEQLIYYYEIGRYKPSTIQNYLSRVNVALQYASRSEKLHVDPCREAGMPRKSGIAAYDHSTSIYNHNMAKLLVDERLGVILDLQRFLGLRFKEACLINAIKTYYHAINTNLICIELGTKGGKSRKFLISNEIQLSVLYRASIIQGEHYSLIPEEFLWVQFQRLCYRNISDIDILFNGERHCYANDRYQQLMGVKSPVRSKIKHGERHHEYIAKKLGISLSDARERDMNARLIISNELGHERINITNSYLG